MNQKDSCCCISHEFYKSASKNPTKIAVIHASPRHPAKYASEIDHSHHQHHPPPVYLDDINFTYSEILESVDSLSRRLRFILDGGIDPSVIRSSLGPLSIDLIQNAPRIVGIYMIPSVEYIISILSVMRCGEVFMPLDPSWPKERVLSVISSSSVNLILCDSTLTDNHWLIDNGSCPILVFSMKTNMNKHFDHPCLLWPCENKRLRSFCYLMFTSGSTGKPKGVCGSEQGLLNRFLWLQDMYPLCGDETLLFKTSIGFIDHLQEIFGALLTSCTLVIPSFSDLKENILFITEYLQDYSINRLIAVPSLMRILLPTLQRSSIQSSLKLLILSGEILHLSLFKSLKRILPDTAILNLYGSTEVSGDCTYFDSKRLSSITETDSLSTVPIGIPIPNCEIILVGKNAPNYGEIYVSGHCIATGYYNHDIMSFNTVKNLPESSFCCSVDDKESQLYFKTGDFAKKLLSGDLVFIGRNDRTVKVNGYRIALEEIENTIRKHEDVCDAAVLFKHGGDGETAYLEAYIVMKSTTDSVKSLSFSIRGWLVDKLPLVMIPNELFFVDALPMSSSGKVDYKSLAGLRCSMSDVLSGSKQIPHENLLQTIKEAFCDALMVENINNNDDFFTIGGDSISAAHTCHKLGINMKLLYSFPTPLKLATSLLDPKIIKVFEWGPQPFKGTNQETNKLDDPNAESRPRKLSKLDGDMNIDNMTSFAISRCNKVSLRMNHNMSKLFQETWCNEPKGFIKKLWKVNMESCVDASPLIVVRGNDMFVYIGSHSCKFMCVKALSGFVEWEVVLEGRVECSAAILEDFSMVDFYFI